MTRQRRPAQEGSQEECSRSAGRVPRRRLTECSGWAAAMVARLQTRQLVGRVDLVALGHPNCEAMERREWIPSFVKIFST
jgi:hypothetical protein